MYLYITTLRSTTDLLQRKRQRHASKSFYAPNALGDLIKSSLYHQCNTKKIFESKFLLHWMQSCENLNNFNFDGQQKIQLEPSQITIRMISSFCQ